MSKCKACGAEIQWIKSSKTGKMIPCNVQEIEFILDFGKGELFITPEGNCCCGHSDVESRRGQIMKGYTSHFATCPEANKFRKA